MKRNKRRKDYSYFSKCVAWSKIVGWKKVLAHELYVYNILMIPSLPLISLMLIGEFLGFIGMALAAAGNELSVSMDKCTDRVQMFLAKPIKAWSIKHFNEENRKKVREILHETKRPT